MSLGPIPSDRGRPVLPSRDRDAEAVRLPVPGVPRAPRAKPKAGTKGYMMRENKQFQQSVHDRARPGRASTPPALCSEQRHPREESPFTYARACSLSREQSKRENQEFPMGPARTIDDRDADQGDFRRGRAQQERPWSGSGCAPSSAPAAPGAPSDITNGDRSHARQSVLKREMHAADQSVEWAVSRSTGTEANSHARRQILAREHEHRQALAGERPETFGRVLHREAPDAAQESQKENATAGHGRRNVLGKDRCSGHDETSARVMGR
jgi:hypothetical protein